MKKIFLSWAVLLTALLTSVQLYAQESNGFTGTITSGFDPGAAAWIKCAYDNADMGGDIDWDFIDASKITVSGTAFDGATPVLVANNGHAVRQNIPVYVFGMVQDGTVVLDVAEGLFRARTDNNLLSAPFQVTIDYKRYSDKSLVSFSNGDITGELALNTEGFSGSGEGAETNGAVPFDIARPLYTGAAGSVAATGGIAWKWVQNTGEALCNMGETRPAFPVADPQKGFYYKNTGIQCNYQNNVEYITSCYMWPKSLFLRGAKESQVIFDNTSTLRVAINLDGGDWDKCKFSFVVKNGDKYYISATTSESGGNNYYTLADFNNSADKKWLEFNPADLTFPADFAAAAEMDFTDVQAVGFMAQYGHQWHKSPYISAFAVEGTKVLSKPLLYEGFAYLNDSTLEKGGGNLGEEAVKCEGGIGWNGAWSQHGAGHIVLKPAQGYGALSAAGLWAEFEGGDTYSCGATRNVNMAAFTPYVEGGKIAKGVLWTSAVMKPVQDGLCRLAFGSGFNNQFGNYEGINIFYNNAYGELPKSANWQVLVGKNGNDESTYEVLDSDIPAVSGEPALVVMKLDFDNSKITLFVNPDMTVAEPDGGIEKTFTKTMSIQNIGLHFEKKAGAAIDEIRFGASYQSVVPVGAAFTFTPANDAIDQWPDAVEAVASADLYLDDMNEITAETLSQVFELKANNTPVDITGTVAEPRRKFNIVPVGGFKANTTYTVSTKAGASAAANEVLTGLFSSSFKTIADTVPLGNTIRDAEALLAVAVEGSEMDQYDAGSKALYQEAVDAAKAIYNEPAGKQQSEIDAAVAALEEAGRIFALAKVIDYTVPVKIFHETFGNEDNWYQGPANQSGHKLSMPVKHYFDEKLYLQSSWGGAQTYPDASGKAVAVFQNSIDSLRIQKIDTRYYSDVKLRLASIWGWWPMINSYSTDGGETWVTFDNAQRTSLIEAGSSGSWDNYEYSEILPRVQDLWIKLAHDKTSDGTTNQVDDIILMGTPAVPEITTSIKDDSAGVAVDTKILFTSDVALVDALTLKEIAADPKAYFVVKETGADGADVAFTATVDAEKKVFTLTPEQALKNGQKYYVALNNRVVANEAGYRASGKAISFTTIVKSAVTVNGGKVEGDITEAEEGATLTVVADEPAAGKAFDKWTSDDVTFADPAAATTTFTMPGKAVTVTATYKDVIYNVTVTDGTATPESGIMGTEVTLTPAEKDNYEFTGWNVTAGDVTVTDNKFTIGTADVAVAAQYKAVDKTALAAAITAAEGKMNEAGYATKYTADSRTALEAALNTAKEVNGNAKATQAAVDKAAADLTAAQEALVLAVDKTALAAAISAAEAKVSEAGYEANYTADSRAAFEAALNAAKEVNGNAEATQAAVDKAAADLTAAQDALVLVGIDGTDAAILTLYPNPATDNIVIRGVEGVSYNIYSMNGQLVKTAADYNGEAIDIADLPAGQYYIVIDAQTLPFIKK
ncbi:MAG: T9SS type A sorting domain-containing protein [Bacteroidales bacterium]|nr:T9SS type A sorting domain-containing protein [Bacteroidales bacterium]